MSLKEARRDHQKEHIFISVKIYPSLQKIQKSPHSLSREWFFSMIGQKSFNPNMTENNRKSGCYKENSPTPNTLSKICLRCGPLRCSKR